MKCRGFESTTADRVDKESKMHLLKESPVKDHVFVKPQCHHADMPELSSPKSINSPFHDKENRTYSELNDTTLDSVLDDSGYLSLQNSRVSVSATEESSHLLGSASNSPSHRGVSPICPVSVATSFTPVHCSKRRSPVFSLSSTPSNQYDDPNLPIRKFQQTVCQELAKGFQKNKKYDWSIVSKVAEDHLLDRVIGRQMGLEYVDMFESLLSRNMRTILTNILALLGDMDLISCKKVSRTWRTIICEDAAAESRCKLAEQSLRESRSSLKKRNLTGDVSRVVLSCMQSLSSVANSSSSSSSCRTSRGSLPTQSSRFDKYLEAARNLKTHESLRPCRRCGSPAVHSAEVQRATCTRPSCLFDFCSCCQEAFHGSTPCRTVMPRSPLSAPRVTQNTPGNARSKRSIRRL
ncbi:F-box only protein 5 [Salarias fasciatus]|uniref:F-box only protein 5 n=1 Tax=Salarias fasciatus TaxID=181472 RepID=UPI001176D034|nr:F-box only protein 5 [Salarias fasciatus]